MRRLLLRALLFVLLPVPLQLRAADHGVILLYHRIADSGHASTRVSPARFATHLEIIEHGGYHVMPLEELLQGIFGDGEVPDKAVAITFDDAYRSVGEVAYPMLRKLGMPFTVFVATDVVDAGGENFLGWASMREMAESSIVTFGPHSLSHAHLESLDRGGSDGAGEARETEILGSLARLREELGDSVLEVFAYPFGEYSLATESLLTARGLYGLAQQSGGVGRGTPTTRIPRFPFYLGGDSDDRLQTALDSWPLVMDEERPADVLITDGERVPEKARLIPREDDYRRDALTCFSASGDRLAQRWDGDVLEISLPTLKPGRNKVNCTAPAQKEHGFYWFSRLWLLADSEGRWLRE